MRNLQSVGGLPTLLQMKWQGKLLMAKKSKLLWEDNDWTFEKIEAADKAISKIAKKYGIESYKNQIEIITSEQMLSAYSSTGMPVLYGHWSYGKQFVQQQKAYKRGQMGLAYEIVINSNPCIAYLMEENTMTMQALVIAHACYGHNSFFKNNYLFKQWTDADSIIDYLVFARNYIRECEEKYGETEVEELIDSCHALMNQGVDKYAKPYKLSFKEEKERQVTREEYLQQQVNDIWKSLTPDEQEKHKKKKKVRFPKEPTENILYFIEKNAPLLKPWQREVVRIVRKISQYFYPQRQTQVMNEGWATFWHHHILNEMFDEGLIEETQKLLDMGYSDDFPSMTSIGYREIILMIKGELTKEEAISLIQQKTRNYAKRQMTWFRKKSEINWIEIEKTS